MNNKHLWTSSKFIKKNGRYYVTQDENLVGIGYRLIGDIQAANYSKLIQKYAKGILFDLGCGNLPLYEMYKDCVSLIFSADWNISTINKSFLDIRIDLNRNFPVKDQQFDTIILTDVLEHIAYPENLWKEISRILKPSGIIIIGVPFFHLLHEEPYDYFRYTKYRLELFCKDNSLKIIEMYPYGGSLELFFDILAKHLSFSKLLSKINYRFAKIIIKSSLGKKLFNMTSTKYPLGYCLVAQK